MAEKKAVATSDKKLYYSIKEVAAMFDVRESLLRYWEKEFPQLHPKTVGNNVRQYTDNDIEQIRLIYNLVKTRGFKIASARKMLSENRKGADNHARIIDSLITVRDELMALKSQIDNL
ncbi:MAG: MerR family transcriptional regulator [Prevotella sp.]|nr:MerR family transcriptional regulator [Prevotella sp.]